MPICFVHLSDIHFGQEKGSQLIIHDDVKERLIEDAARQVKAHATGRAHGLIVSGDIAYAGKSAEYKQAASWLDRLTAAVGCEKTAAQIAPGNHDIDLDGISSGCRLMLEAIVRDGEAQLDAFLEAEIDREALYNRFAAYRPFAEGYNCPLDRTGGIASDRRYELAPGRTLRVIGLNSALICQKKDVEGRLLLGARQHVLPRTSGEELVVICHHPLRWLQDSDEARRYVRNRARVFVSGHEHNPSLRIETIKPGCDLMTLEAGATVPPRAENGYTYTYNLLMFEWDAGTDGLKVTVVPRAWSEDDKDFAADDHRLGGHKPTVVLGCPNFRMAVGSEPSGAAAGEEAALPVATEVGSAGQDSGGDQMSENFALLLLRFFRDLSPSQRLAVLLKLRLLPDEWRDPLTHSIERHIVDKLAREGRLAELEAAVNDIQSQNVTHRGEVK
jgi:hypothetical protein